MTVFISNSFILILCYSQVKKFLEYCPVIESQYLKPQYSQFFPSPLSTDTLKKPSVGGIGKECFLFLFVVSSVHC